MLHTETKPHSAGLSAAAAVLAREFAEPEVCLCQGTAWRTAETEDPGKHLFMTAPGRIHREATA
jgi:hypothetical protein